MLALLAGLSPGVTLLRVLINVGLLVIGGHALYRTLDSMFQDTVGLIELSFMELMFLALYLVAAIRIRRRLASHGVGVTVSVLTLLSSAGWCALGNSLALVVGFVIGHFSGVTLSASYRLYELPENTWFQAMWFGMLLICAYLAAPRLNVAPPSQDVQEAERPLSEEPRT